MHAELQRKHSFNSLPSITSIFIFKYVNLIIKSSLRCLTECECICARAAEAKKMKLKARAIAECLMSLFGDVVYLAFAKRNLQCLTSSVEFAFFQLLSSLLKEEGELMMSQINHFMRHALMCTQHRFYALSSDYIFPQHHSQWVIVRLTSIRLNIQNHVLIFYHFHSLSGIYFC